MSIWPEKAQNLQPSAVADAGKEQQWERTVPGVKYECATPFSDGMNVGINREGLLALIVCFINKCQNRNNYGSLFWNLGALHDALFMTTKLLNNFGQGIGMVGRQSQNSPLSLEVWIKKFG